jgi:hypothetical protein
MAGLAKPENKVLAQPSWPDEVYRVLKEAGVKQVGMVPMRGDWGEFNPWQIPMGQGTQAALEAMGVIVTRADEPGVVAPTVWGAANLAFNSWRPAAVLIGQRVLGAKNFKELAGK